MDADQQGPPEGEQRFVVEVPVEIEDGVYSDMVYVWHSEHGFTLDFGSLKRPPGGPGDGPEPVKIVARVRIPPGVMFPLTRALSENLDLFERRNGPTEPGAIDGE